MVSRRLLLGSVSVLAVAGLLGFPRRSRAVDTVSFRVAHTDAEWRQLLSPMQYRVLREEGTEAPGSSPLDHETRAGRYDCAGCAQAAFSSQAKFDSHTGWPSFWQPLPGAIGTVKDTSLFMTRIAVHCSACGGHFGHVFDDGPRPTGLRYCMNGAALSFHPTAT